jgi:hypothetical protein
MKLNWGKGIALVYTLFMIGVLIMVYIFMNQDVSLVTDDYYSKTLTYQKEIDKINRTNLLPENLLIKQNQDSILFTFPKMFASSSISGLIFFYRPSDQSKDFVLKINPDSRNTHTVPTKQLSNGLWKIKVEWSASDTSYYNEKIIMVN